MKNLKNLLVTVALAAGFAHADPSPLQISGKVWAEYSNDLTSGGGHKNGFDVYRAFLQANYTFEENWSSTLLLDAVRTTTVTSSGKGETYLLPYVRNAFVEGKELWSGKGGLRFGLQPNFFIALSDATSKTRWLGKSLTDQTGLLKSQTGGLALTGELSSSYRYGVMIHNGSEGLNQVGQSDSALALAVHLQVKPFVESEGELKKLSLQIYDEVQSKSSTTDSSNLVGAAVLFEHSALDATLECVSKKPGAGSTTTGFGSSVNVKFNDERASVWARYQLGNASFKSALGGNSLLSFGPTYALVKGKVSTGLVYELKPRDGASALQSIAWKWAANF